ncbi:MAG: hypothetical protein WAL63_05780 [Solirubrobacteraceae bacterium]
MPTQGGDRVPDSGEPQVLLLVDQVAESLSDPVRLASAALFPNLMEALLDVEQARYARTRAS